VFGPASAQARRIHSVMPDIHDFPGTPSIFQKRRPCEGKRLLSTNIVERSCLL
jgi:hypothetical protein